MEYGELIDSIISESKYDTSICSDLYTKHVGFSDNNPCYASFFSAGTIRTISKKITQLLQGVDPKNRPIIVPDNLIINIMNSIYTNYRPITGDIYSRYNIPNGATVQSYVTDMIDQVIEVIVSDVKANLGMEQANSSLSIWTTVLGDFNEKGLRAYAPIKVLNKRPNPFQFNMNY